MQMPDTAELLLNATLITASHATPIYEFILAPNLQIKHCAYIHSLTLDHIEPIPNFTSTLANQLFEINHIRVNPEVDYHAPLECLANRWHNIGIILPKRPRPNEMALCFKPLGTLSSIVRFYVTDTAELVFLNTHPHLKLIHNAPHHFYKKL